MDKESKLILNIVRYCSLFFASLFMTILNYRNYTLNSNKLIAGVVLMFIFISLRELITTKHKEYEKLSGYIIGAELFAAFIVLYYDVTLIHIIFFLVIISDIVLYYNISKAIVYDIIIFMTYVVSQIIKYELRLGNCENSAGFPTANIMTGFISFLFIFCIIYISKRQINQKQIMSQIIYQFELKNKELEHANHKLQESAEQIEEMTILKERNRIAREIHDTVGHTLTTVLVELEAGKRLMRKDISLAEEKLDLSEKQIRKGLNDIRQSVRTLKDGNDIMELIPSLQLLIREAERHAGISVASEFGDLPHLNHAECSMIYNALQEGLTNGIRHGESTHFDFSLKYENDCIIFVLKNNGKGFAKIEPGFGVTAMQERIEELGGEFKIESPMGKGCVISISVPLGKINNIPEINKNKENAKDGGANGE